VGVPDAFFQGFAEKWSEMFRRNQSLVHVDMSHNNLKVVDCEIMAEGLKQNHKVLGLHFQGNYGDIDKQGFLHSGIPKKIGEEAQIVRMQSKLKGGIVQDSRCLELSVHSNCWVCEGWSEVRFLYTPGKSDNIPNHDVFIPINLHLEFEHYTPDLMLACEDNEKVYECYRMLPPGKHKYYYSIGGDIRVAKD